MKRRRRKSPPELDDLIRRARANPARRHHVVPAMYLRNFADDRGLIRVTDHVAGRDFLKKPEKVALVTDFYRMDAPEVQSAGIPPLLAETLLADIERTNAPLVRALIHDAASLQPQELAALGFFIALQFGRGQAHRRQQEVAATQIELIHYGEMSDEDLRDYLRDGGFEGTDDEVEQAREHIEGLRNGTLILAPDKATSVGLMLQAAKEGGLRLFERAWTVSYSESPLITSDEPVVLFGTPGSPRSERGGLETASVIAYPLSPHHVLLMIKAESAVPAGLLPVASGGVYTETLTRIEALQVCREVALSSQRWTFEHPSTRIGQRLWIPEQGPAAILDAVEFTDTSGETALGFRSFPTTRWAQVPHSWWPSGRLWPDSVDPYPRPRRYAYAGRFDEVEPARQ